jgi:hypothetical protein
MMVFALSGVVVVSVMISSSFFKGALGAAVARNGRESLHSTQVCLPFILALLFIPLFFANYCCCYFFGSANMARRLSGGRSKASNSTDLKLQLHYVQLHYVQ